MSVSFVRGLVGFGGWILMGYIYTRHILLVTATDSRMLTGQVVAGIIGAALLLAPLPFAVAWCRSTRTGVVGVAAVVAGVMLVAWLGVLR